ncbi:MAG TPA: T9SS type A sorting domain-containing protein [Cytophagaceae bacterium]
MISTEQLLKRLPLLCFYLIFSFGIIAPAFSQQYTYTKSSGDFSDGKIWTNGVPKTKSTGIIMVGHEVTLTKKEKVGGLIVAPTAKFNIKETLTIVENDFVSYGEVNAENGGLVFSSGFNQYIDVLEELKLGKLDVYSKVIISNQPVVITGTLTVNSGHLFTNGKLVIASSENKTGKVAPVINGTIEGDVTVQQYIYSPYKIWRYLSSPVANATIADWQNEIPVTGTFANPNTGSGLNSQSPSIYYYDETFGGGMNNGYVNYPNNINSNQAAIQPGRGYAVYVRNNPDRPKIVDVTGNLNMGIQHIPVTYTSTSGGIVNDGWNLVGNPYACPINWSNIHWSRRQGLDNAIYLSDNSSGTLIHRSFVDGVGTPKGTTGLIAASQGFWVKANSPNPILIFNEFDKELKDASLFRNNSVVTNILRVIIKDNNTGVDETVIRIKDEASLNFDNAYDALKLDQSTLKIFTVTKDNKELSINSLSLQDSEEEIVELKIDNVKPGTYTISFDDIATLESTFDIFLKDNLTGEFINVKEGAEYSFNVTSDPASYINRFGIVVYKNSLVTSVKEAGMNKSFKIQPNPCAGNELTILLSGQREIPHLINLTISDLTGKVFIQKNISDFELSNGNVSRLISVESLPDGIYTVIINTGTETFVEKLIIE